MKVLMDADCLIKLTKAGLKSLVCSNFEIFIPQKVKDEIISEEILKKHPESIIVNENIINERVRVLSQETKFVKGDDEILAKYNSKEFDIIATDDKRLIRKLSFFSFPYVIPSVLIYQLYLRKVLSKADLILYYEKLKIYVDNTSIQSILSMLGEENENTNN